MAITKAAGRLNLMGAGNLFGQKQIKNVPVGAPPNESIPAKQDRLARNEVILDKQMQELEDMAKSARKTRRYVCLGGLLTSGLAMLGFFAIGSGAPVTIPALAVLGASVTAMGGVAIWENNKRKQMYNSLYKMIGASSEKQKVKKERSKLAKLRKKAETLFGSIKDGLTRKPKEIRETEQWVDIDGVKLPKSMDNMVRNG